MVGASPAGGVCWARAAGWVRQPSAMTNAAARRARYMTISLEDREHTTVSRRLRDGRSTENPRRRMRDGESETENQRRRRRRLRRERDNTSNTEARGNGGERRRRRAKQRGERPPWPVFDRPQQVAGDDRYKRAAFGGGQEFCGWGRVTASRLRFGVPFF